MLTLNDTMLEEVSGGAITRTKVTLNLSVYSFNKQKNTASIFNVGSANGTNGAVQNVIDQGNNVG